MPGFNPEKLNIHELTIEEPEKGESKAPFITEEDWENIIKDLEKEGSKKNPSNFAFSAMTVEILDSDRQINIDKQQWDKMEQLLEKERKIKDWDKFSWDATAMKVINSDYQLNLTNDEEEGIRKIPLFHVEDDGSLRVFPSKLIRLKILDPAMDLPLSDIDWKMMDHCAENLEKEGEWRDLAWLKASIRIADPKKNVNLSEKFWAGIRDTLDYYRQGKVWDIFSEVAMVMKILAADKAEVTNKGLKLTMPQSELKHDTPEMPYHKDF